ncbi:SOS response-associated peptidase family protein [Tahibacter amnicola]|uniref:SOS response-associated peptidase family protein n=1 Tax=Tahibacter amnicola TaxID=2976241 RepID=A0ABY6BM51_9GAMM|nr:SOS response-associated peptidase family protein [Tahibacter amnicola]UXI70528.1 SOS response-associated peptidase family protein [Tahibacter amnicola]
MWVRLIKRSAIEVTGVRAVWGLVQEQTGQDAARDCALRNLSFRASQLARHPVARPLWQQASPSMRCLVPASGWVVPTPQGMYAVRIEGQPATLAGIVSRYHDASTPARTALTFALVTVDPEKPIRHLCSEMPAVIRPGMRETWLGGDAHKAAECLAKPWRTFVVQPCTGRGDRL